MNSTLTSEFYSTILQHSHDMITIIDPSGIYKYVSNSVELHFGFKTTELVGNNALHHIHAEDLPYIFELLENIKTQKQIKAQPFRYLHQNGNWRWLSMVLTNMLDNPIIQGYVTNSRDITEEVELMRMREKSEAYYKALFFNHPDLVFTMNEIGLINESNDSVSRISGYFPQEAIGKHFTHYIAPSHLQEAMQAFRKVISGGAHTFSTRIINKNEELLDLCVTLVPVWLGNRITAVHCIAKDITQIKLSERLLKEQAAQLSNILGSITEGFFALNREWCFTYANRTFANYFKVPAESIINRNIWQNSPELVRTLFYHKCQQVMSTGEAIEFEEYIETIQATTSYKIYPFEDGIAVCFTDITAKNTAQNELKKLSLVASKTTNGVIITDKKGKVEWVNASFTKLTGFTQEEMLHQDPITKLQGQETNKEDITNLKRLLCLAIPFSEELLTYKKDGGKIWIAADITPILNEEDKVEKFIVIYTDISDRKFAEEQLLQMNENLVMQNRDLQQFTYIVSHNLRAPVANMIGLTRILPKLDINTPNYTTALQSLDKSVLRLDNVICDLSKILSIKNPENGDVAETIDLKSISEEVLNSMQDTLFSLQATIELQIPNGLLLTAKRAYLHSVLHNLVTNAIKYRSTDRTLHLRLKAEHTPQGISLLVQDNGLGMDMEVVRPHIFKLYKRFHVHTEGTGLGLYLVKSQVEAIGGTIDVDSTKGHGTTFRVFFRAQQHDRKGVYN
ncbi:PAS domain S-box protein [Pontibacter sp. BT310]|uniref:histidine kinase n=1 Tax=Pontibacter populi TaxID=890055 RepID=A0ABS6X630_9BACT|nr:MULTISPECIES: PAS domain S-box protein [Pontibacter]MBJ6116594.1 PAS domain S-box protein [Pontibacter sp. BT310]MBR0569018.1 PAS domain S-box protein [Microvirga sp. STS03]MBW3363447.1 PAS domain S-box protein [Pontibacter populi]